jgi:hypothetical protein
VGGSVNHAEGPSVPARVIAQTAGPLAVEVGEST